MIIVSKEYGGQRLQNVLKEALGSAYSGKAIKAMIDHYGCRVNGKIELFSSYKVHVGDRIHVDLTKNKLPAPSSKGEILYEDDEMIIWNKPAGALSERESLKKHLGEKTFHLVHRLDKETTGVMVLAKTRPMQKALEELFRKREVHKVYHAIAQGQSVRHRFVVHNQLRKLCEYAGQAIWGSGSSGLEAITHFKVLKKGNKATLIECSPVTGRTHQIRVHLAEESLPIMGDAHYLRSHSFCYQAPRILLHAASVQFNHPTKGVALSIEAPYPDDFMQAVNALF